MTYTKEEIISMLNEVSEYIEDAEYNRGYNTCTMLSYEEWKSKSTIEILQKLRKLTEDLQDECTESIG